MTIFRSLTLPRLIVLLSTILAAFAFPHVSNAQTATTTTTTLKASACSTTGCATTLTATVTAGAVPVHPGLVLFCKANVLDCADSLPLGQAQLLANGTATVKLVLPAGSNSINAIFQGTKTYGKSQSSVQSITMPTDTAKQPTITDLSVSGVTDSPVFTATVTALGKLAPTGTTSFLNAANQNAAIASAPLGAAQSALAGITGDVNLSSIPSGNLTNLSAIASGDFNNDGLPDLVVQNETNISSNTASVNIFLNTGKGFAPPANASPISAPYAGFLLADFNSDGKLDIALLSILPTGPTQILIYLGNGDGTFTAGPITSVNNYVFGLTIGDFNGDGIPDLVGITTTFSFGQPPYSVITLLGSGNGAFQQKASVINSGAAGSILVSDFNQDGIQDLLVNPSPYNSGAQPSVLIGNGDGTFTPAISPIFSPQSVSLESQASYAIGDFDNDGIPDLAAFGTTNSGSSGPWPLLFLRGKGDGTFTLTSTTGSYGSIYFPLQVADINGDGIPDLVAAPELGNNTTELTGFLGHGDGTFAPLSLSPSPSSIDYTNGIYPLIAHFNSGDLPNMILEGPFDVLASITPTFTSTATATASTSLTVNGIYNIFASYPGDPSNNSSVSAAVPLSSTPISYPNGFADITGLSLNGGASTQGSAIQLTDSSATFEHRSFFNAMPVSVQAFSTNFDFQLLDANADGFAFVIQSNGPNALGSAGGGLGYSILPGASSGASIPNSIAVKFDIHNDQGEGNNSVGVYTGGALPTVPAVDLTSSGINLHSGDPFHAVINYSGTTLSLTITDETTNASFTHNFTVDIPTAVGGPTAYVGFTAATGALTAIQKILAWSYISQNNYSTPVVPSFASGFSDSIPLSVNGYAVVSTPVLELIQPFNTFEVGTAFFGYPVPVNSFTTDFDFQLGPASAVNSGGDGFTFVLQEDGLNFQGGYGEYLGYAGSGLYNTAPSLAVKFDLHNNAGEGDNSTGLYLNGAIPTVPAVNLNNIPGSIRLHNGHTFHARIHYDGTNLYLSLTDLTDYTVYNGSFPVNIPQVVGASAYAGFTSASGEEAGQTQILNWTWSNN